jgi:ATP-dependent DNA ligase
MEDPTPSIVSKHRGSHYMSGRSDLWRKVKNPTARAVRREAEEDWGGDYPGRHLFASA